MPPHPTRSGSSEAAGASRFKEREWKRSRGAIACAECRRLKLKCDKGIPCSSCTRRGCPSICPNGSLMTGQGTRFVLADTDRLHGKITEMSDRIRQLEDALAVSHSNVSRDPHPLLQRDLLKIKSIIDLHSAIEMTRDRDEATQHDDNRVLDTFGTLALREDGASTFYGRSAGHESLILSERDSPEDSSSPSSGVGGDRSGSSSLVETPPNLPRIITEVSATFPDASMRLPLYMLEAYLPPWPRASHLCTLYLEQAPWFFGAVKARQLHEELLPLYYVEARPNGTPPSITPTAHDLALLFVIFCFGAVTDGEMPPAPVNEEADRFYALTRAALALAPPMDRPPTVSTVQAFSLMAIHQGIVGNENSIESTWALMGLATKLAQSIGLHRDCARWNLAPSETQKRRELFWELFITDCWQSLATGRLPTFSLPFVDCELPQDIEQFMTADGTPQASFPYWKAQFGKECVAEVVAGILTARPPKYSIILDLDRKIRDTELPQYAFDPPPDGAPFSIVMQHFMPANYRCLTLLYVHRAFFAQGLCDHPIDPLRGTYAPSILSGYRSACQLLSNLQNAFNLFPSRVARFWVLWTHAFSASVMLALVPVRAPRSKMAHGALTELRAAHELFDRASPFGGRAVKMLPIVKRHLEKATESFHAVRTVTEPFSEPKRDEFAVFSGMTSTVRAPAASSPSPLARSSSGTLTDSSTSSPQVLHHTTSGVFSQRPQPPEAAPPPPPSQPQSASIEIDPPPWSQVHPALMDQLISFEAQIAPSPVIGGYIYGHEQKYESPGSGSHTPHTQQFPFLPPTTKSASPSSRIMYSQPAPVPSPAAVMPESGHAHVTLPYETHHTHHAKGGDGSSPASAMSDGSADASAAMDVNPLWNVAHTDMDMEAQFVRPRSSPSGSRALNRVLRQSGDLSLTEAWSQFITQMDIIPPIGSQRPS
ncbi:fungal-specific transcription factor domain-containing protein [Multifurca ochricompacta]|uniref:Fungal-specific transcription factor domain-containing protein n=1 Tax=Multifurca ochricompacta TaxID=376703 RepID=A0AAD4QK94_9AGAM|nr:fungal-specific transcription factor domain-containing protein [Multifurca ochricompacta]